MSQGDGPTRGPEEVGGGEAPALPSPLSEDPGAREVDLTKFAWLSIAAALATIGLKTTAWWITGSVGLLSDAAESVVNLVAAVVALYVLTVSRRPADDSHHFGHHKAEYFSAALEGQLIFVAALFILWTSVQRFFDPQPLENLGWGLVVSVAASVLNGVVALVLLRAGRSHRSLTLIADGKHLMTDVWTSVGVLVGIGLVAVTGWERLDPVVAFLVGLNIMRTGYQLLHESVDGLMDHTWPEEEMTELAGVLDRFRSPQVQYHGLRTRTAGRARFADLHLLVPGEWSVQRSHDLVEDMEAAVRSELPDVKVMVHVEPVEDPRSHDDYEAEFRPTH